MNDNYRKNDVLYVRNGQSNTPPLIAENLKSNQIDRRPSIGKIATNSSAFTSSPVCLPATRPPPK
jgi:hypothetical protein